MCKTCGNPAHITAVSTRTAYKGWERIAQLVHSGQYKLGSVDADLGRWFYERYSKNWLRLPVSESTFFNQRWSFLSTQFELNIKQFAAAKSFNYVASFADFLGTGESRLNEEEFAKVTKQLNKEYTVLFQKAEQQTIGAASQMAGQWVRYKENAAEVPNLKYETVGDDRVRPDHMALDGVVRPITDPFWSVYYPPNGYNCRCDVQATTERVSAPGTFDLPEINDVFINNVGETGKVFSDAHPYFKAIPAAHKPGLESNFGINYAAG